VRKNSSVNLKKCIPVGDNIKLQRHIVAQMVESMTDVQLDKALILVHQWRFIEELESQPISHAGKSLRYPGL